MTKKRATGRVRRPSSNRRNHGQVKALDIIQLARTEGRKVRKDLVERIVGYAEPGGKSCAVLIERYAGQPDASSGDVVRAIQREHRKLAVDVSRFDGATHDDLVAAPGVPVQRRSSRLSCPRKNVRLFPVRHASQANHQAPVPAGRSGAGEPLLPFRPAAALANSVSSRLSPHRLGESRG